MTTILPKPETEQIPETIEKRRLPRLDAVEKATGYAKYVGDIELAGMLHGRILRSPHAHARIVQIETSRAEAMPGVRAVITAADAPDVRFGHPYLMDRVVIARNVVRFVGEPIAAVAAVTAEAAEAALDAIEVRYEELPAVFEADAALRPDAPILHPELEQYATANPVERKGNLAAHIVLEQGSIDRGFAEADLIVEETYRAAPIHQAHLEPHACVATVDPSGKVTVWTSTQNPFGVRSELSQALRVPLGRINVVPTTVGGAFGGKLWVFFEPICVLLARKAGRPVRMEMSYEEEFVAGRPRVGCTIKIRTGVKRDGTLVARHVQSFYNSGAYAYINPGTNGAGIAKGPYRIPNVRVDTNIVYTNRHPVGAMRGPGAPQMVFAVESHMDTIAGKLNIDPLDLRRHNGVTAEDFPLIGDRRGGIGYLATLEKAAARAGWGTPLAPGRGRGIACGQWGSNAGPSTAYISVNEDGSVRLLTGAVDLTGSDSIMAQIVAHELGITAEDVEIVTGDTDSAPFAGATAGSRMTYAMGTAAKLAALDARRQLREVAATKLGVAADQIEVRGGALFVGDNPEQRLTFADAVAASSSGVGPIVGKGSISKMAPAPTFITTIAEVVVDRETGAVKVERLVVAEDVGYAINPLHVEGQIEGGLALGVGQGLLEEILYHDGDVLNPRFGEYQIPRATDVPRIEIELVETASVEGPYGARGVGEPPAMPGAAAIANAVRAATGARVDMLPLSPERVWRAVREAADAAAASV